MTKTSPRSMQTMHVFADAHVFREVETAESLHGEATRPMPLHPLLWG